MTSSLVFRNQKRGLTTYLLGTVILLTSFLVFSVWTQS